MRMHIVVTLGLLAGAAPALAGEVYRWVDENGVVNFSDTLPGNAGSQVDVNTMTLQDAAPEHHDPDEDIYHVAEQAERMQALRDEMEKEREARREQRQRAARQPVDQVQRGVSEGYPYVYPAYGRPPYRPPARPPQRPIPEPYDTSTLRPSRPLTNPRDG